MKNTVTAVLALLVWTTAHAGPTNADPFGLELGVATRTSIEATFKGSRLSGIGTSAVSGGPMFEAQHPSVGPDGITRALLVLDKQGRLVAVQMTLPKDFHGGNIAAIADQLSKKYAQQSRNLPRLGDGAARYTRGTSIVMVEAPHLSFEFTVTYMTDEFERGMVALERSKQQQKSARTRGSL